MSVRPAVCPSAKLVDSDFIVQQKIEITCDMPKPIRILLSCDPDSAEEDQCGMENVEFCTSAASSGSYVALSQHLMSFMFDTWYCINNTWLTVRILTVWTPLKIAQKSSRKIIQKIDYDVHIEPYLVEYIGQHYCTEKVDTLHNLCFEGKGKSGKVLRYDNRPLFLCTPVNIF